MPVNSKHPEYILRHEQWELMRTSYEGEDAIKKKGVTYLPPTDGMEDDGMGAGQVGLARYEKYKTRASYPEFVADAVEAFIGMLSQKEPDIRLPTNMEYLRNAATLRGEGLELLLRRIYTEQLVTGRFGLLADIDNNGDFYINIYPAENIINWDDAEGELNKSSLNLVVLDESGSVRNNDFEWEEELRYRVLILGEVEANEEERKGFAYRVGIFNDDNSTFDESALVTLKWRNKTIDKIPFVIGNSKDIIPDPDKPPLIGLARLSLSIYRADADYRDNLHKQGQDTLVIVGDMNDDSDEDESIRIGPGSAINVGIDGDAKFIGTNSRGLSEQRRSLENDKQIAETKAGQVIKPGMQVESGESVRRRVAAQTVTLTQIAKAGASALEEVLRTIAIWKGLNPLDVEVIPNTDFDQNLLSTLDLVQIARAKNDGLPISYESIHNYLRENELTEKSFLEEIKQILSESELRAKTDEEKVNGNGAEDEVSDKTDEKANGGENNEE